MKHYLKVMIHTRNDRRV